MLKGSFTSRFESGEFNEDCLDDSRKRKKQTAQNSGDPSKTKRARKKQNMEMLENTKTYNETQTLTVDFSKPDFRNYVNSPPDISDYRFDENEPFLHRYSFRYVACTSISHFFISTPNRSYSKNHVCNLFANCKIKFSIYQYILWCQMMTVRWTELKNILSQHLAGVQ